MNDPVNVIYVVLAINTKKPIRNWFIISGTNQIYVKCSIITGLQINLYLEQPIEIQLFAKCFQRRK
jgi:hypothetical protein